MTTGFVWHERYCWHDFGAFAGPLRNVFPVEPGHAAEHAETKRRIKNLLDATEFIEHLHPVKPHFASRDELLAVHTADYLDSVKALSDANGGSIGFAAFVGPGSYEIAALSAGGVIAAADSVLSGRTGNAYALVRPPGHHAQAETGMGFCVFANIALAVKHARSRYGLDRIAVVDWDVHHGNGTQSVFYDDPGVLTISLHQDGVFPRDSGHVSERGSGRGEGYNINIPLPPGCGQGAYHTAFDRIVMPALDAYRPQAIFVACGYDAGMNDPLARMMLGPDSFRFMTQSVMQAAQAHAGGRVIMAHEGGYHAPSVPFLALPVFEELTGERAAIENPMSALVASFPATGLQPHQDAAIETARAAAEAAAWRRR